MIDAAQDEVGPLRHQRLDSEHHTIRGRAVNLKSSLAALDGTNWMVKGERMARRALFPIRSDDGYFTEWLGGFDQASEPLSQDAIVVRAEQPQRLNIPARCRHNTLITSHASRNSRK